MHQGRFFAAAESSAVLLCRVFVLSPPHTQTTPQVARLVPFMSFGDVEAVVVDAVKYDYLQVRVLIGGVLSGGFDRGKF